MSTAGDHDAFASSALPDIPAFPVTLAVNKFADNSGWLWGVVFIVFDIFDIVEHISVCLQGCKVLCIFQEMC